MRYLCPQKTVWKCGLEVIEVEVEFGDLEIDEVHAGAATLGWNRGVISV